MSGVCAETDTTQKPSNGWDENVVGNIGQLRTYNLCYLATPYTKYPGGTHLAFVAASVFAAKLLGSGVKVYSPITHTHPLSTYGNLHGDFDFWLGFDEIMMRLCDALLVAKFPTWEISRGVKHEIEMFKRLNKDIHYLPDDMFG